jgi:hypothetical protein
MLWLVLLPVAAQGAPEAIFAALRDLSTRIGRDVTLDNRVLENWSWSQESFPDSSLGCPTAGEMYAQVITPGYIFNLQVAGTLYEYHVSVDGSSVRLCDQRSAGAATALPLAEQYSNPLCVPPTEQSGAYPRSRVMRGTTAVGMLGQHRIRAQPSTDAAIVATLDLGSTIRFEILNGPQCDEKGIVWWEVSAQGITGWTAEAQAADRFLAPLPPDPLPLLETISTQTAISVSRLTLLQGNLTDQVSFTPDNRLVLAGGRGSDSLILFTTSDLANPRYIDQDETITALAFHPNNQQVVIGTADGGAHLWNTDPNAPLVESLYLLTHLRDVLAVAVYPDGSAFASAGTDAQTTATVDRQYAIVLWDTATVSQRAAFGGHSAPVIDLAFSADGVRMTSVDSSGAALLWTVAAPAQPIRIGEVQGTAVAFSPNAQFLAVGGADGGTRLLDPVTGGAISLLRGHLNAVTALAFSPDNTLLATVSADGTLRLWNTQSDEQLATIEVDAAGVLDVAFSPDGRLIAVSLNGGKVVLLGVASAG